MCASASLDGGNTTRPVVSIVRVTEAVSLPLLSRMTKLEIVLSGMASVNANPKNKHPSVRQTPKQSSGA